MQLSPAKPNLELRPEGGGEAGEEKLSLTASLRLQVDKMRFSTLVPGSS